ncbi:MAG: hypothetical protein HY909_09280 [Deltaproteobacteria bacterium]|nr:hypothetical protein [Deltaproteobacteria bacterium]
MGALAANAVAGFVNLGAQADRPAAGSDATTWLRAAVRAAAPAESVPLDAGTGTLFLPAGEYYFAATGSTQPGSLGPVALYVPSTVTLWFDPGARFVLDPEVVIEIEGDILAGLQRIFECRGEGSAVARVRLTGNRLREVLPEWWGARPGEDSGRALQLAMDAAFHAPRSANVGRHRSPIPVTLSGLYRTSTTLLLGRSPFDPAPRPGAAPIFSGNGLWLRGTAPPGVGPGGAPASGLRWLGPPGGASAAVLSVEAGQGWLLEDLTLDGDGSAPIALHLAASDEGSNHQSCGVRQCVARGATSWQVAVGPAAGSLRQAEIQNLGGMPVTVRTVVSVGRELGAPPAGRSFVLTPNTQDFSLLRLECCQIEVSEGTDDAPTAGGVLLQAANAVPMQFLGCLFTGRARAMIQLNAGALEVEGCRFANSATGTLPKGKLPIQAGPVPLDPRGPSFFSTGAGCDIFLGLDPPTVVFGPGEVVPPPSTVLRVYLRRLSTEKSTPEHRLLLNSVATGSLLVRDCQTSSRRFLASFDPSNPARQLLEAGTAEGNVVLENVQQRNADARGAFTIGAVPAVEWNLPGPGRWAPSLVLVGCHFDGRVVAGPEAGDVYCMGTTFSRAAWVSTPAGLRFGGIQLRRGASRLFVL